MGNLQTITRKMTFLLLFLFGLFALGAVPVQAEGDDERRCAIYLSADVRHWGTCLFAEDCVASDLMYSNDAQQCWGTGRTCCMPKITCDHNNDGFAPLGDGICRHIDRCLADYGKTLQSPTNELPFVRFKCPGPSDIVCCEPKCQVMGARASLRAAPPFSY